ncbi:MAG: metallopeptidase family protein [Arcanobacterium sp.]|nr:metallopeptidase family protein [Arcanobacterium sp.]MDY5589301.1 metallopeptidase family protein [Arcanobacterium sp.]
MPDNRSHGASEQRQSANSAPQRENVPPAVHRSRSARRVRRDRHGRGMRGPSLPPMLPAWRTRAQMFDDVIAWDLGTFRQHLGERMDRFDFAVLDVPHSDPAPWEDGVPLGRVIPFERPSKIAARVIFYRMPIIEEASRQRHPRIFIHEVVTNHLASALGEHPEDIDYLRPF